MNNNVISNDSNNSKPNIKNYDLINYNNSKPNVKNYGLMSYRLEQYKISRDFIKSTIFHLIIIAIIGIAGLLKNIFSFFVPNYTTNSIISKFPYVKIASINQNTENSTVKHISDPIKATLIDHNMVQQAILRQEIQTNENINKAKNLEQQEKQIANLKKLNEQEALKLKQEIQKAKNYNKQLQEEQKKLKQQSQAITVEKQKLSKQAEDITVKNQQLSKQAEILSLEQKKLSKLSDKYNNLTTVSTKETTEKKNLKNPLSNLNKLSNSELDAKNANQALNSELNTQNFMDKQNILSHLNTNNMSESMQNKVSTYYAIWKNEIINNRKKIMFFTTKMTCAVRMKLLPNGHLALVKIEQSSGNHAYDKFSEQAIYKSAPFEMPEDPILNKELTDIEHIIQFDDNSFSD